MSAPAPILALQPHAPESEAAILGACLYDPLAWPRVKAELAAEDFWVERARIVYGALDRLSEAGAPIDEIGLVAVLRSSGELDKAGGAALGWLGEWSWTSHDLDARIREVRERSLLRKALAAVRDWSNRARGDVDSAPAFIDELARELMRLAEVRQRRDPKAIAEVLAATMAAIERSAFAPAGLSGVPTGFAGLDEMTDGWQRTDLIVVAARPGMGKSAFAVGEAVIAARSGVPSLVFSLEMSADQLGRRILSFDSGIDLNRFRRCGAMNDFLLDRTQDSLVKLQGLPLWIDDQAAQTPESMLAKAQRIKREHGLGLVIVDYVQLMRAKVRGNSNREQEVAEISRSLKLLAKDLDVPVIACCQLSRKVEDRLHKVPILSDLRESGAIEQDADLVVFLHRAEMYERQRPNPDMSCEGQAEIHIAKQRNGETGKVDVRFEAAKSRFVDEV